MWLEELKGLDDLYRRDGADVTLEEKDFASLIGNSFVTSSIADAYALQLFDRFAEPQDMFLSSEAIVWVDTRNDFVVMTNLLPTNVGPKTRVFCVCFHLRHKLRRPI